VMGGKISLLIPYFLSHGWAGPRDRLILAGFRLLKFLVAAFNLHGGHVMVFAVKEAAA